MDSTVAVERKSPASSHLEKDTKVYSDVVSVNEEDLQKVSFVLAILSFMNLT